METPNERWVARLEALAPLMGGHVELEPLREEHVVPLWAAGHDPELWRWTVSAVGSRDDMAEYVAAALRDRGQGSAFPFVIRERVHGTVVGCTRYGNIDAGNRRLEIGWTWLDRRAQRSGANTEAKYLLLRTAFEELECVRVELKTDVLNLQSRAAIARIGAKQEGVLRQHMITATGRLRDTVYYSILDAEWPAAELRLRQMLRDRPAGTRQPRAAGAGP